LLVIRQRSINSAALLLYKAGDKTNPGLRPACSCPAWGVKSK
jgi:hypothetical protein